MGTRIDLTFKPDGSFGTALVVPLRRLLDGIRPEQRGNIEDLAAWPVITRELDYGGSSGGRGGGTRGDQSRLRPVVQAELRRVLGGLPKADGATIQAALQASFELHEYEGMVKYKWVPRSYTGLINTGPGVTGAQASVATFARTALDASLPIIERVPTLDIGADPQELEAARAILRSAWIEFVEELAVEGGPRAARADQLATLLQEAYVPRFGILLGVIETDATGHAVRDADNELVIVRTGVVLTAEETTLGDFIAIADYIRHTADAWDSYHRRFLGVGAGTRDLGTGLVRVERSLTVIDESVDEVYASLDSVFVGPDERLTITFDTPAGDPMAIEELLSWVQSFARTEAPALIEAAGIRGLEVVVQTIQFGLQPVVAAFQGFAAAGNGRGRNALQHPRVLNATGELAGALENARLAAVDSVGATGRVFA
ncbi:MAG: hypothetical protein QOJ12_711 [Thermoleophilales bacterium]|nr:hypothetical protein [Thermoleophilales bacterium]